MSTAATGVTGHDLSGLRWLGRQVLAPSVRALTEEVPAPCLVSAGVKRRRPDVCDYVLGWVRNADGRSRFASRTRWLRWLPGGVLLRALLTLGYDGLVYARDGAVIGHVYFQRRGRAIHGFSAAVDDASEGKGYSVAMMLDYLALASRTPGVARARVGRGENRVTCRLLGRLKKHEERLGWHVGADGWVTFSRASETRRR